MGALRAHGLLIAVYAGAIVLAAFELTDPDVREVRLEQPEAFLEPERNIADVSAAVHPGRALTLYYQAYQAALCGERAGDASTVCPKRGAPKPGEVRELIERSLATGNRSIELAYYNYALVLLQEGAPEAEIDAAIRAWRETYPRSARPDPREVVRSLRRRPVAARSE